MINESKARAIGLLALVATIGCAAAQTTAPDPCVENGLTDGFLPNPADCTKYFSCYGGSAYEMTCPDGKFFDPARTVCDIKANVPCVPNNCPPDGIVFLPIPGVCNRYTICIGGSAFEGICDDELYFDAVLGDCNLKNESGCVVNPCQQPPPNPPILEIHPNEADCQQYLICLAGEPVIRQCATGLFFDPNTEQCAPADDCIPLDGGATTVDPAATTTTVDPAATTTTVDPAATTTTLDPALTTTEDPALTTTEDPTLTTTEDPALTTTEDPALTTTVV